MEKNIEECKDGEIDFFDILIVVAENIKPLIITPALIGFFVFFCMSYWPSQYDSGFVINAGREHLQEHLQDGQFRYLMREHTQDEQFRKLFQPRRISSQVMAASTLDAASNALKNAGHYDWAQALTKDAISSVVVRNAPHVQVNVRAASPEAAQAMARELLKATLSATRPSDEARAEIEAAIRHDSLTLEMARRIEARISQSFEQTGQLDRLQMQNYYALLLTMPLLAQQIKINSIRLEGLTIDDVINQPTLPTVSAGPKRMLVTVLAIFGTGLFLLLWLYFRWVVNTVKRNPKSAAKLDRICKALGI